MDVHKIFQLIRSSLPVKDEMPSYWSEETGGQYGGRQVRAMELSPNNQQYGWRIGE